MRTAADIFVFLAVIAAVLLLVLIGSWLCGVVGLIAGIAVVPAEVRFLNWIYNYPPRWKTRGNEDSLSSNFKRSEKSLPLRWFP